MKKRITSALKLLLFLSIGALLFWLAYRGQDFGQIMRAAAQARWVWVLLSLLVTVFAHYSRALRWRLLLEPLGCHPRVINLFCSVMVMYLSNMAIPRSGEVARCGILSKYEKTPFAGSLGTVVAERVADLIVSMALTLIVLLSQWQAVAGVVSGNPALADNLRLIGDYAPLALLALLALSAAFFYLTRWAVRRNVFGIGSRLRSLLSNFKDGLLAIVKMRRRWAFVLHSILINFAYFFSMYLVFKAFAFTENLSMMTALTLFVLSTFGVVVPSPGGIGTWHFIVIEVLGLYGVSKDPDAGAYALVMHGMQDLLFILTGFASLMLLPAINRNYKPCFTDESAKES